MLCVCKGGTVAPSARTGPATCAAKRADVLGSSHLGRVLSWLWIYPNYSLLTKLSLTAAHLLSSIRHSSRLRWRCLGWPLAWSAQIPLVLVPTPLDSLPVRLKRTLRAHPHRTNGFRVYGVGNPRKAAVGFPGKKFYFCSACKRLLRQEDRAADSKRIAREMRFAPTA